MMKRFSDKFTKQKGCWEWTASLNVGGYGKFGLEGKSRAAHRVSMHLYRGFDLESPLKVCYKCDNPKCVNPDHLYIGTQQDNMRDREARHRRNVKGERHSRLKLTNKKVLEIRDKYKKGRTQVSLSQEYGITQKNIWATIHGINWSHIGFQE